MTLATFLSRRRRVLALCAATAALHVVAIDWFVSRIGLLEDSRRTAPAVVQAELRLALPQHVDTPAPPDVQPAQAAPKPKRARQAAPKAAPAPPPEPMPEAQAADDGAITAAEQPPPAGTDSAPPEPQSAAADQSGAAQNPGAVQSAQPEVAQPEAAPPPGVRSYRVNPPPSASFELDVQRTDADGKKWSGSASMAWQTDGSNYKVGLDVGITVLFRVNLLTLNSEGIIDDAGIAPVTMREKRRGRPETATHFNQEERRITFSASEKSFPLLAGAQDKATVPFQLAAIGRADVNQFGSDVDILVGEDRAATIYRFQLVGEEELETDMGKLVTWRLARPPRPGSYSARLDIWLAPSLYWYPVQIRNTEGNGAVTTQTVKKIRMNNEQ